MKDEQPLVEASVFEDDEDDLDPSMPEKLTEWSNEPHIRDLKADLEASKSAHDAHAERVRRWNNLMKVEGAARAPKVKGRSQVQPKLIRRQAEWRYSALSEPFQSSDKLFDVQPVTFEDEQAAIQNSLVLNWQFRTKINRVRFIDEFIRTNVDDGSCVVRLGWKRRVFEEEVPVPVWEYQEPFDAQQVQMLEQAIQQKHENPRAFDETASEDVKAAVAFFEETGQPAIAVAVGEAMEVKQTVIENRPTLEFVHPDNFYIEPSCGNDVEKANFAIVSFETSKAELLKEPERYRNLDTVNWDNASILSTPDHASSTPNTFNFKDELRKRVVAYEYWGFWDIHGTGELVPIVATWVGDTLVRLEENPFPDQKLPFVITNYMPLKRELMGEPDAELLEDNQKIHGAVMRGMVDLLGRSANGQQGFAKGMLDTLNRRRYENGQDYEFNPNMPPNMGIIEHKYPDIPQSAMLMLQLQNQEAEALTGVKSFSGGLSGEAYGDVAAGIRGALDAASKREMAILRRMAKGVTDIGIKIIAMNGEFLSEEEVVRVTNSEFVTIRREELAGNFDLEVDISTAEVDNNKAQDLGFMLQTIGPNLDFGITKMILMEIARLKRMPGLVEKLRAYEPTPDPLLEEAKKLEVEKLRMEIAKLQSETTRNQADAQMKLTQANQNDLNTIEQETGTKHERDMDKMRAQAQGNQSLEVTKSFLKTRKPEETQPNTEAAIGWNRLTDMMSGPNQGNNQNPMPNTYLQRDQMAQNDPRLSLGSKYYDPSLDAASNPSIRL